MNSYGLGLILNFVDNASSGMRNATNVFNQMSGTADSLGKSVGSAHSSIAQLATTGTVLTAVGDAAAGMGTSIMKAYMGIGQTVIETGGMFIGYERQLEALYKDADKAVEIVERMKEYAEKSVFEIDDLISSVTMMKVVGIEALDAVTSSSGETSQTLLDYASDIAAMIPNLRNIYGTGSSAAMGALKEYIAEGNAMTLKRSAGLDITGLLGEDKGKTIEERSRQVADLVELLGIAGYTASLFGTPGQILSNLADYWKNFMGVVAKEGGVYENYSKIITKLGDFVTSLVEDTDRYDALVEIVSNVVNNFLDLADRLLDKVLGIVDAFTKWAANNPELVSTILKVGMALGGVLVVFGLISKYAGSFFLLRASMMALRGSTVGILSSIGSSFFTTLLPMIGLAYLLKKAWDKNLWGIKDTVKTVFSTALITIKALFFGVRDESGRFSDLSEEDFKKAEEMGVLPFIEAMLELKENVKKFVDGFKIGFNNVITKIKEFGDKFFNTTESAGGIIAKFGNKLKALFGYNTDLDFAGIGEKVGGFAAKLLTVGVVVKVVIRVFSFLIGIFKFVKAGVLLLTKGFGLLKVGIAALFSPIGLIIAAVAALVGVFVYMYQTSESFRTKVNAVWEGMKKAFENVVALLKQSFDNLKQQMEPVIAKAKEVFERLRPVFEAIFAFIAGIFVTLFAIVSGVINGIINAIAPIVDAVLDVVNIIIDLVGWVVALVKGDFEGMATHGANILESLKSFFVNIWNAIAVLLSGIWDGIVAVFSAFGIDLNAIVSSVGSWISNAFISARNAVVIAWNSIVGFFQGVWDGIVAVFSSVITSVTGWFTGVQGAVEGAVGDVSAWASTAWTNITGFFSGAITSITGWFTGVATSVEGVVGDVSAWASTAWTNISNSLSGAYASVTGWFTGIGTGITDVVGDITSWATDAWTAISGAFSGAVDLGSGLIEGFKTGVANTWEAAKEAVSGFFGNIWSGIKGIFGIASPSTEAISAGENITESFSTGVSNKQESALSIVGSVFKSIWEGILGIFGIGGNKEANTEAKSAGEGVVDGIVSGLTDKEAISKKTTELVDVVINGLNTGFGTTEGESTKTKTMAENLIKGLNNGLVVKESDFTSGAESIKTAVESAVNTAFGTQSVGVFGSGGTGATKFENLGKNIAQGIVWGLQNSKQIIKDALTDVSGTAVLDALVSEDIDVLSKWTELTTSISTAIETMKTTAETSVAGVITAVNSLESESKTPFDTFETSLTRVSSTVSTQTTTIASSLSTMATNIITSLNTVTNAFSTLTWKLPNIKMPTVSVSYSKDDKGLDIPKFDIIWNAKGGIFDSPTIFNTSRGYQGVGEAGAEAILPLSDLWSEMTTRMRTVFAEASTPVLIADNTDLARSAQPSQTTNVSEGSKAEVHFAPGSFVVQLANGTQEELKKAALELMKIIERQTEIKNLATRGRKT